MNDTKELGMIADRVRRMIREMHGIEAAERWKRK